MVGVDHELHQRHRAFKRLLKALGRNEWQRAEQSIHPFRSNNRKGIQVWPGNGVARRPMHFQARFAGSPAVLVIEGVGDYVRGGTVYELMFRPAIVNVVLYRARAAQRLLVVRRTMRLLPFAPADTYQATAGALEGLSFGPGWDRDANFAELTVG